MVKKSKYALNNVYGVRSKLHSSNLRTDTDLKNAKTISKCIVNRKGFCYADTDCTYVEDLDKK